MHGAPEHERPAGAVPQPAEHHCDHQVHVASRRTPSVSAERNVEIVAQERATASCANAAKNR